MSELNQKLYNETKKNIHDKFERYLSGLTNNVTSLKETKIYRLPENPTEKKRKEILSDLSKILNEVNQILPLLRIVYIKLGGRTLGTMNFNVSDTGLLLKNTEPGEPNLLYTIAQLLCSLEMELDNLIVQKNKLKFDIL